MENFYYTGPLFGLFAFLIIGIFHPIVIKMEYHLGKKSWWILFFPGLIFITLSLFGNNTWSIVLGVLGFSCLWSTHEIFKQHERVIQGRAKKNPNRNYSY